MQVLKVVLDDDVESGNLTPRWRTEILDKLVALRSARPVVAESAPAIEWIPAKCPACQCDFKAAVARRVVAAVSPTVERIAQEMRREANVAPEGEESVMDWYRRMAAAVAALYAQATEKKA